MGQLKLDANRLANEVVMTVKIAGLRRFLVRLWIVIQLLKIVAWVAPFRVEVDKGAGDGEP